ncbi:MAG: GAF domain-containing protein [Deltaproteobacteria bacterium]|nr:GAF domain-containing protein [Deltaproteobacteria bacterium]
MNLRKRMFGLSMENQGLHYRLSIIFAFFFFVPLLGLLYFGLKYDLLEDRFLPVFILALLASSLAGYVLIRKTFDHIRRASRTISDQLSQDIAGFQQPTEANELQGIVDSFQTVEHELRNRFNDLERRTAQLSTLKELSDLCYVTFDSEDLFAITLERALKLTSADVGSILILEGRGRENFVVHATYGLGDLVKIGDRVDFATSIAKFAVINKSPLLIGDIEKDTRFGRGNRSHYATKSFLCMPLKGIQEVFGVLTLSRRQSDTAFTTEDTDILTPLLSNAAFTYDNLSLMKREQKNHRRLAATIGMGKILGSSLKNSELLHAILNRFQEDVPFDIAVIMEIRKETPDRVEILEVISPVPIDLDRNGGFAVEGSSIDGVIRQGNILAIDQSSALRHPLEQELLVKPGVQYALLAPLKIGGVVTGVLALGSFHADALKGYDEELEEIAALLPLAIEKSRLSSSVTKRDQEMASIQQIGSILAAATFDRQEVLKHTMDMIRTIVNVEAGSLLLLEGDELAFKVAFNVNPGINTALLNSFRTRLGQGIAGYCAARGESIIVRDTQASRHFSDDFDRQIGFQTRSALCVPLISRGKVLGVIEVLNKLSGDFNDDDLHLLQSIATSVSIALENSQLYRETLSMAEHERGIRKMFQKFVPLEIVDKIIHNAGAEKPWIEELKILTLLNIDIRGFSTLSKKIGPQRTVAILNRFFSTMGEIVFNHGGIVDKYLGDGFLALFGAPVSGNTDADNAIAAALEMKESLQAVNDHFSGELDAPLAMGISIHTGEAVVGNIGFEKKMDYTVIGDAVNAVFRLQDLTKSQPNSILVSEKSCHAVVESILDLREIGKCDTGGPLGELRIYELLGRMARVREGSVPLFPADRC